MIQISKLPAQDCTVVGNQCSLGRENFVRTLLCFSLTSPHSQSTLHDDDRRKGSKKTRIACLLVLFVKMTKSNIYSYSYCLCVNLGAIVRCLFHTTFRLPCGLPSCHIPTLVRQQRGVVSIPPQNAPEDSNGCCPGTIKFNIYLWRPTNSFENIITSLFVGVVVTRHTERLERT